MTQTEITTNNLPKNTRVITCIGDLQIIGVVVGKARTDTESYIIKCIDGQLPNSTYQYDTFISPMRYITVLDTSFEKWEKFYNVQRDIETGGRQRTMNPMYAHKTHAKNESEITRGIEAHRIPNGSVEIRITAEDEWHDPVSLSYTLPVDEVEKLVRVLSCDDTSSDGLIERAAKFGGDSI